MYVINKEKVKTKPLVKIVTLGPGRIPYGAKGKTCC